MPTRVVVVHDEPGLADELGAALNLAGHQVATFADPLAAWDALGTAQRTDALITGVQFPPGRSNGLAFAHMAHLNRPTIQVIFVARPEFARECGDDGLFLPIPVSVRDVAKTVALALQRRAANADAKTAATSSNLCEKTMENFLSNRRSDDQLGAILCETGHWAVNGRQGQVLGYAASLRRAIERSVILARRARWS